MRRVIPMQFYAQYHSPLEKQFLGVTVPAGTAGPQALKTALDALAQSSNVGPFIATRLIQHMVTSNPSPPMSAGGGGLQRQRQGRARDLKPSCARCCSIPSRDAGQRSECRQAARAAAALTAWMRAFNAASASGNFRIGVLDNQLSQTPMRAPSVFNFFRPGFVPPNTSLAAADLVAPEFRSRTRSRWRRTRISSRARSPMALAPAAMSRRITRR